MNVMNVGKLSGKSRTLVDIRGYIQEKNAFSVMNVEKHFGRSQTSLNISDHTQGRNPIIAVNVGKPLATSQPSHYTREPIQGRNLMNVNVMRVGKLFTRSQTSLNIREYTQV